MSEGRVFGVVFVFSRRLINVWFLEFLGDGGKIN